MYVYMLHISLSLSPFLSLSLATIILSLLHSCWESRSLSYSISSLSLPPSLLLVSLCISIISSRCIRVRLVCVDSDKKRAKTFDSDKKRASSLVHVQGKSWYQSVEFLSLSLSLLSFCLVSFSDRNQRERRGVISKVTPCDKKGTPGLSFSLSFTHVCHSANQIRQLKIELIV